MCVLALYTQASTKCRPSSPPSAPRSPVVIIFSIHSFIILQVGNSFLHFKGKNYQENSSNRKRNTLKVNRHIISGINIIF